MTTPKEEKSGVAEGAKIRPTSRINTTRYVLYNKAETRQKVRNQAQSRRNKADIRQKTRNHQGTDEASRVQFGPVWSQFPNFCVSRHVSITFISVYHDYHDYRVYHVRLSQLRSVKIRPRYLAVVMYYILGSFLLLATWSVLRKIQHA